MRALGPTVGGTLWSFSLRDGNPFPLDRHMVYYLLGLLAVFSFFQSGAIPRAIAVGGRRKH